MSLRKQAEGWGLAFLLVAILTGLFYLATVTITVILSVFLKNNTEEENQAIARLIVVITVVLLILLNL